MLVRVVDYIVIVSTKVCITNYIPFSLSLVQSVRFLLNSL